MKIEEFRKKHGKFEHRNSSLHKDEIFFMLAINGLAEKMEKRVKKSGKTGYRLRLSY